MAFVPDCRHDVFVSYAHVDDMPFPGAEKGWVTNLIETLQVLLAQKLGRREGYSLWMDHQLSRHADLTPEILDNLSGTATLLVILSPGYVASKWCLREKDTFLEVLANRRRAGSRVFVVERDRLEPAERPTEFADLLGYRFWEQESEGEPPRILGTPFPDPKNLQHMSYFDRLTRLGADLAAELKALREAGAEPDARERDSGGPTVYLAEATDDLDERSEAARSYLEQAGLRVLPQTLYPREPDEFQKALDRDLAASSLFVQLLSELPGKRPPGLPEGYVRLQYDRARAAGMPILQWRRRRLEPESVADDAHRALLEGETVMAVGADELHREILRQARPEPPAAASGDEMIFVDAEAGDMALAEAACEALEQRGLTPALPLRSGKPSEVREDFEQNLMFCDGVLVVRGEAPVRWVRDQLLILRKMAWKRDEPLKAVGVLEASEQSEPLRLTLPNLQRLDARGGIDERVLEPFLAALTSDA